MMIVKLYERQGEVTRDLEIQGTLTEVLCAIKSISEDLYAEDAPEDGVDFEIDEEEETKPDRTRGEWIEALVAAFNSGEEIEFFGKDVIIEESNAPLAHFEWLFRLSDGSEFSLTLPERQNKDD